MKKIILVLFLFGMMTKSMSQEMYYELPYLSDIGNNRNIFNDYNEDFISNDYGFDELPNLPDPCTMEPHNEGIIIEKTQLTPESHLDFYTEKEIFNSRSEEGELVLIVNGNGLGHKYYEEMARFLAKNGFRVGVLDREGHNSSSEDPMIILDALNQMFDYYHLNYDFPLALIGHSVGGAVVNNFAVLNHKEDYGFHIKSIINMSLNATNSDELDGYHSSSYLALYGSRDEDVVGNYSFPHEAFMMYDRVGTESTTTCSHSPCITTQPRIDKTMVHVFGANHSSLMDATSALIPADYLAQSDQACVGKAYINAFLRWKMRNQFIYKGFLRNEWKPVSFNSIKTNKHDGLVMPMGSDLRLMTQFSPQQKQSIENFEDNSYSIGYQSEYIKAFDFNYKNTNIHFQPFYYRHHSNSLLLGWESVPGFQYISFNVPDIYENAIDFSHLSIRIGQVKGEYGQGYDNDYTDKNLWIGILDDNNTLEWVYLNSAVSRTDRFTAMSTLAVRLDRFDLVDFTGVSQIFLAFESDTNGSVIIDNIEWIRD